jgi:glutathione S-transferase
MEAYYRVAIVSLLALLVYFQMGWNVGKARQKSGVAAPAMSGDPVLEPTIRVHYNTLEWLPIFLVSLWLFAIYVHELTAAVVGVVWIVGRELYARGYVKDPSKRETGFLIQALACAVLLFGAFGMILYRMITG